MTAKLDVESLCPHPFMIEAWVGCLAWAIGEPDILKQFQADTGVTAPNPRNGLERMIDEATGRDEAAVRKFVEWFNADVWGDI